MYQIGMKKVENREYIYDFIRVFACFCIICIHCTDLLVKNNSYNCSWWIGNVIQAFVRIGLPMFVLLSGVLILNKEEEKLSSFYLKRFVKIIIPLYVYSFIYVFVKAKGFNIDFIGTLKQITEGPIIFHLWYVYMIIGIYLCAPYIQKMCKILTDKDCINLFVLICVIIIIKYLLPIFDINIGINNLIFIEWSLIFLLGYLITKEVINKQYKIIYILGIVSFVFSIIAKRWFPNFEHIYDLQITMIFEVMALYLFFYRNKDKLCVNRKINTIVGVLSKYSWEVYLIHIEVITVFLPIILSLETNQIISVIILIIIVAVVSFISAVIIHNIIIKNLQKLVELIVLKLKNINKSNFM